MPTRQHSVLDPDRLARNELEKKVQFLDRVTLGRDHEVDQIIRRKEEMFAFVLCMISAIA
jgi:hypothetical protein